MNAKKIKDLRFSLELTQPKFAEMVGVSTATVKAWEGGKNRPSERLQYKLNKIDKES